MVVNDSPNKEAADLERSLAELDRERASVLTALGQLKVRRTADVQPRPQPQMVRDAATATALSFHRKNRVLCSF